MVAERGVRVLHEEVRTNREKCEGGRGNIYEGSVAAVLSNGEEVGGECGTASKIGSLSFSFLSFFLFVRIGRQKR